MLIETLIKKLRSTSEYLRQKSYNDLIASAHFQTVSAVLFYLQHLPQDKLASISEYHGLTEDGVDYALRKYQKIISHITHGRLSKLSYNADDVIRMVDDLQCEDCDLKEPVLVENQRTEMDVEGRDCGICENWVSVQYNYCPFCGRRLKWR